MSAKLIGKCCNLLAVIAVFQIPLNINALPPPVSRITVNEGIINLLEKLRCRMDVAMPDLEMPILDPFAPADQIQINITDDALGVITGTVDDLMVTGLKQFVRNEVDFDVFGLTMFFNLSLPTINATGRYDINGIMGDLFPLFGKGDFRASISNVTAILRGELTYANKTWGMPFAGFDLKIDEMAVKFEGLMNNAELEDFFNDAISELGPIVIDTMWPSIEPRIAIMIREMVVDILDGVDIMDLIAYITGEVELFPPLEEGKTCPFIDEQEPQAVLLRR